MDEGRSGPRSHLISVLESTHGARPHAEGGCLVLASVRCRAGVPGRGHGSRVAALARPSRAGAAHRPSAARRVAAHEPTGDFRLGERQTAAQPGQARVFRGRARHAGLAPLVPKAQPHAAYDIVELAAHLVDQVRVDQMLGPRPLLPFWPKAVWSALGEVEDLALEDDRVVGESAIKVLEFLGWIWQDMGDARQAAAALSKAAKLARSHPGSELSWYARARELDLKSHLQCSEQDMRALRWLLSEMPEQFVVARSFAQKVLALLQAQTGDTQGAYGSLDESMRLLELGRGHEGVETMEFLVEEYLRSERMKVSFFARDAEAITWDYQQPSRSWGDFQRRDYAVAVVRCALHDALRGNSRGSVEQLIAIKPMIDGICSHRLQTVLLRTMAALRWSHVEEFVVLQEAFPGMVDAAAAGGGCGHPSLTATATQP